MLVLSRKTGEKIRIGDNVTVTIVRIGPNNVRLGIDAPRDLNIVREELVLERARAQSITGHVRKQRPSVGTQSFKPKSRDLSLMERASLDGAHDCAILTRSPAALIRWPSPRSAHGVILVASSGAK